MSCEDCQELRYAIANLGRQIDSMNSKIERDQTERDRLASEVEKLRPYKEAFARHYDNYVTNSESVPKFEDLKKGYRKV